MDAFQLAYKEEQEFFKKLATFDFESICVKNETYKDTEITEWVGKHVPIWVSISSNLVPNPIFLRISDHYRIVSSFITALEGY